jgi:transposase
LDPSFVPPPEIQQLRELLRHRVTLVQERNRLSNRVEKLLQGYGVKLSSVASDILGQTGQRILQALAAGQTDAERLSWKAVGSLRQKEAELWEALRAEVDEHGRWLLGELLEEVGANERHQQRLEERLRQALQPYQEQMERLCSIPGVSWWVASSLIAELGVEMSVFPSERHCASWAGLCPGTQESAGKQYSCRTRKGNRYIRRILTQAAWAVSHCKRGYLRAMFYRLSARRGAKKAVVAVAHRLLVIAYHVLRDQTTYADLGEDYFDLLHREQTRRRLVRRLERLGYTVTVEAAVEGTVEQAPARKRGRPCKCAERGMDCKHGVKQS